MTRVALFGLLATTGCAQLLGLDSTTSGPDAPGPAQVTAEVVRMSIGATVVSAPEDLTANHDTLAFLVPDSTAPDGFRSVAATQGPIGTWSAAIPDGNPVVDFTLGGQRHVWAFPTRDLKIADPELEHPNPTAAPTNSALALSVTLPSPMAPGEIYALEELGPWLDADLTSNDGVTITQTVMTSAMGSLTAAPYASVVPQDVVVALRYVGSLLTGAFQAPSFTETDGGNSVSGTMSAVTADQTFQASIDPTSLLTRFAAVRPAVGTPALGWRLGASPGSIRGETSGVQLDGGIVAATDTVISSTYGNPFTSNAWPTTFTYGTYETRMIMVGTLALQLASGASSTLVPDGTMVTLDLPAAIPQTISLAQQPLSTDNTTVMIDPTMYAPISLVLDRQTTTMYQAILYEVVPADATDTQATLQYDVEVLTTDLPSLAIPPDALQAGHTYTLHVACYDGGFTGAGTGDLQTTSPPFHSAYTESGVFTVMNP